MSTTINIKDFLADDEDREDVSAVLGVPLDEKSISQVPTALVVRAVYTIATNFAEMISDICEFLRTHTSTANPSFNVDGCHFREYPELTSSWQIEGRLGTLEDIGVAAHTLASNILGFIERLDAGLYTFHDKSLDRVAAVNRSQEGIHDYKLIEFVRDGDYNAIRSAYDEISQIIAVLRRLHAPLVVVTAFEEVYGACGRTLARLSGAESISGLEAGPAAVTLLDELLVSAAMARTLCRRDADVRRAETGMGDFYGSQAWLHRWRVYELWVLTHLCKVLERMGGEIRLCGVVDGAWILPYGQSDTRVALCTGLGSDIDVFYQFIEIGADRSFMPDIYLATTSGKPLVVVDPKHGRSYSRHKVKEVGDSYSTHFRAPLCAVVNYFGMDRYAFEEITSPHGLIVLGSNIRPGTFGVRQLDVAIEKCLTLHGHSAAPQVERRSSRKIAQPSAEGVLYWTSIPREVDEPEGFWWNSEESGSTFLEKISREVTGNISQLSGGADARTVVAVNGKNLLIITADSDFAMERRPFQWEIDALVWHRDRTKFLVKSGEDIFVLSARGEVLREFASPSPTWAPAMGWVGNSDSMVFVSRSGANTANLYFADGGGAWNKVLSVSPERFGTLEPRIISRPNSGSSTVEISPNYVYRLSETGDIAHESSLERRLSVSHSGRYDVMQGPESLRAEDGVAFLRINDMTSKEPGSLIRYFGEISGAMEWSSDETGIAFMTSRRYKSGYDDLRLMRAKLGDRDATSVSVPGASPTAFSWFKVSRNTAKTLRDTSK